MALFLALVFSLSITPSLSTTCQYSSANCYYKTLSGSSFACYDAHSCAGADITATASVSLYGYDAAEDATISALNVYARGWQSAEDSYITATGLVQLSGDYSGYDSKLITAPLVQIWGYRAAIYAEDIIADTVDITGYQGAYDAKITASKVDVTGYQAGWNADIYPKDGSLNITFQGFQSGYNTDILCDGGVDCAIRCATPRSCYGVMFYCVGNGQCIHSQQCDDSSGDSDYCLSFYQEGVGGLTAVDIYDLYEKNKARRHAPTDEEPINDGPNKPDGPPPDSPTIPIHDYYFSLTTAQFVILCALITVLFVASTASCIYTVKTAKNKGFRPVEKEDFQ